MFFKKRDKKEEEYAALKEETRSKIVPHIEHLVYEIEAHRAISTKSDLWTAEEFTEMVQVMIAEAREYFEDMDPEEILEERMGEAVKKLGAKVIEVRI